jgi:hypothetical protein
MQNVRSISVVFSKHLSVVVAFIVFFLTFIPIKEAALSSKISLTLQTPTKHNIAEDFDPIYTAVRFSGLG